MKRMAIFWDFWFSCVILSHSNSSLSQILAHQLNQSLRGFRVHPRHPSPWVPLTWAKAPKFSGSNLVPHDWSLRACVCPWKVTTRPKKERDHLPGVYYPNLNGFHPWVPHGFLPGIRSMQLCHDLTVIPIGTARLHLEPHWSDWFWKEFD